MDQQGSVVFLSYHAIRMSYFLNAIAPSVASTRRSLSGHVRPLLSRGPLRVFHANGTQNCAHQRYHEVHPYWRSGVGAIQLSDVHAHDCLHTSQCRTMEREREMLSTAMVEAGRNSVASTLSLFIDRPCSNVAFVSSRVSSATSTERLACSVPS